MILSRPYHQPARLMEANVDKAAQKSAADLASILESNWHSTHIVQVIDKLDKQNPSIHTLVKHKLGRLVKKVHGKALEKADITATVMAKWRHLISPTVPQPEAAKQKQSKLGQTANLQLAIHDKPTTTPLASPTSPSTGQSGTTFETLLQKIGTCPASPSSNSITAKRTFELTSSPKKRVRFVQDAEQITSSFRKMHICKDPTLTWYRPRRILIPDACKRPTVTQTTNQPTHHNSCFTSRYYPHTPPYLNDEFAPKKYTRIIPLFELDMSDEDEPCFHHSPDVVDSVPLLTGSLPSSYHPSPPSPSSHLLQTQHYSTYH